MFRHRLRDSRECLASFFGISLSFFLPFRRPCCSMRSCFHPFSIRDAQFGGEERRNAAQPQACRFHPRFAKIIWLHDLCIFRQIADFDRHRILDDDARTVSLPKSHEKRFRFPRFFHPLLLYNTFNHKAVCPCLAQISAWRMCNQHIPLAHIVHLPIHCPDKAASDSFQRIAENVPFWMAA